MTVASGPPSSGPLLPELGTWLPAVADAQDWLGKGEGYKSEARSVDGAMIPAGIRPDEGAAAGASGEVSRSVCTRRVCR